MTHRLSRRVWQKWQGPHGRVRTSAPRQPAALGTYTLSETPVAPSRSLRRYRPSRRVGVAAAARCPTSVSSTAQRASRSRTSSAGATGRPARSRDAHARLICIGPREQALRGKVKAGVRKACRGGKGHRLRQEREARKPQRAERGARKRAVMTRHRDTHDGVARAKADGGEQGREPQQSRCRGCGAGVVLHDVAAAASPAPAEPRASVRLDTMPRRWRSMGAPNGGRRLSRKGRLRTAWHASADQENAYRRLASAGRFPI